MLYDRCHFPDMCGSILTNSWNAPAAAAAAAAVAICIICCCCLTSCFSDGTDGTCRDGRGVRVCIMNWSSIVAYVNGRVRFLFQPAQFVGMQKPSIFRLFFKVRPQAPSDTRRRRPYVAAKPSRLKPRSVTWK